MTQEQMTLVIQQPMNRDNKDQMMDNHLDQKHKEENSLVTKVMKIQKSLTPLPPPA